MRWSTILLLVLVGVVVWYYWPQTGPMVLEPTPETSEEDQTSQPPPPPQPQATRITCPVCGGEGQLMLRQQTDPGRMKSMRSGGVDKPYACQVCGGCGFRELVVPVNGRVCPDCGGMGKRVYDPPGRDTGSRPATRLRARPCMRCNSKGYLVFPPGR